MTKPETAASMVIVRALVAATSPDKLRRLLDDIRDSGKGTA